jgi:hypothetical protein
VQETLASSSKLLLKLRDRINLKDDGTDLRNIVKDLQFLWKNRNNRVGLIKNYGIRHMQIIILNAGDQHVSFPMH